MDSRNDRSTGHNEQVHPVRRSNSVQFLEPCNSDEIDRPSFPEISSLIIAAGQHAWLVLALSLLTGCGLAYTAWKLIPPDYIATSYVHVRHRSDYLVSSEQTRNEDATFVRAQESTVVLPQVMKNALADPDVLAIRHKLPERSPGDWLASTVQAKTRGGSEVMAISVRHDSPEVAQILTNAVTHAYLQEITTRARADRERRKRELERLAKAADTKLNARYQELQGLAESLGSGNLEALSVRDQIQLQGFREYAQQLRSVQLEKNQLQVELADALSDENSNYDFSDSEIQFAIESHPDVIIQQQRISDIDFRIREIAEVVSSDNTPRMLQLRQDREYYENRLQNTIDELRPRIREEMRRQRKIQYAEAVDRLRHQLTVHEKEEQFLKEMLSQMDPGVEQNLGRQGVKLEMLRHEIHREEGVADNLWRSLEQMKIEEQAQERVTLLEEAKLPDQAIRSEQIRGAVAAGCLGIGFIVFAIGWVEWKSCRVRHPRDFTANIKLQLFGVGSFANGLPWLWKLRNSRRDPLTSGINEVAAQLILNTPEGRSLPSVLVSSAVHNEPRHLIALQLASALSRTGRRVLLVDYEPGNSALLHAINADYKSVQLGENAEQSDPLPWIRSTSQSQLDFVHLGGAKRDKSLAASRRLALLLDRAIELYDGIIVHGPAILTSSDSVLLASQVETTLLSLVVGKSRWNLIAAAKQRLQGVGGHVLGAIMHVGGPVEKLEIQPGLARPAQSSTTAIEHEDESTEEALVRQLEALRQDVSNQTRPSKQDDDGVRTRDNSSS